MKFPDLKKTLMGTIWLFVAFWIGSYLGQLLGGVGGYFVVPSLALSIGGFIGLFVVVLIMHLLEEYLGSKLHL